LGSPKLAAAAAAGTSGSELSRGDNRSNSTLSFTNNNNNNTAKSNTNTNTNTKATHKPPANNKLIHHFFSAATSINNNNHHAATSNHNNHNNNKKKAASTNINNHATTNAIHNNTSDNNNNNNNNNNDNNNNEWIQKCQNLTKLLQDRDEQLKAVANNRTILQSALQTALTKKSAEHDLFQQVTAKRQAISNVVLEELLQWKSATSAKQLRERLATDGARLGRIVYARAGMRAVESWEEGYATKDLEQLKATLKSKRQALEERSNQLVADAKNGTAVQKSVLEQVEGTEAVRMHLENCHKRKRELAEEEMTLNDEKGAHIRALKRVASEDASRFRSRPKVRT
jgi:hypothetical protein